MFFLVEFCRIRRLQGVRTTLQKLENLKLIRRDRSTLSQQCRPLSRALRRGHHWRVLGRTAGPGRRRHRSSTIRLLGRVALVLVLALSTGCVHVQPRIPSSASPSPTSGYIGGLFAKDTIVGFGFSLRNEWTGRAYVLEVEDKTFGLIAVPPGRYRVASWVTWALTGERLAEKEIPASDLFGQPFDVEAGQVILLGSWSADRHMGFGSNTFTIVSNPITNAKAVQAFEAAYPRFADKPIRCLLCMP